MTSTHGHNYGICRLDENKQQQWTIWWRKHKQTTLRYNNVTKTHTRTYLRNMSTWRKHTTHTRTTGYNMVTKTQTNNDTVKWRDKNTHTDISTEYVDSTKRHKHKQRGTIWWRKLSPCPVYPRMMNCSSWATVDPPISARLSNTFSLTPPRKKVPIKDW